MRPFGLLGYLDRAVFIWLPIVVGIIAIITVLIVLTV